MLRNPLNKRNERPDKDIELLEDISGKIDERVLPIQDLKANAIDMWSKYRRQEGFVVAIRKAFHIARQKSSGTSFNETFNYCRECIKMINEEGQKPGPDLCAVAASVYYEWNVNRYETGNSYRDIEWAMLYDLARVALSGAKYADDPVYTFICAVCLCHLGKWPDADHLFSQIRRAGIPSHQLYSPRAVLLDEQGVRRKRQGVITGSEDHKYFKVEDLGRDFYVSRYERWPNADEDAHAYIGIAFAGPVAVLNL
ncbi:MAG: hypothetical protein ACO1QR_06915 [Chthoniobacteraceae bacterium]